MRSLWFSRVVSLGWVILLAGCSTAPTATFTPLPAGGQQAAVLTVTASPAATGTPTRLPATATALLPATNTPTPEPSPSAVIAPSIAPIVTITTGDAATIGDAATAGVAATGDAATDTPGGITDCAYRPGGPVARIDGPPAAAPALQPTPTAIAFAPTYVAAAQIESQLEVFNELTRQIEQNYVYADFNGQDWPALVGKYEALIRAGLSQEDFYRAMTEMVISLGDRHSYFQTPEQRARQDAMRAGQADYVGIGGTYGVYYLDGEPRMVLSGTYPGSPAEEAGLKSHDVILSVNGGRPFDPYGVPATLGAAGTALTLEIQSPGEPPRTVTLTRRRVTGQANLTACRFAGTRIGYLHWMTFVDNTLPDRVRQALLDLTAAGPLDGLIVDMRMNGGGDLSVQQSLMGYFTGGNMGSYVTRTETQPFSIEPVDVNGSQTVPLLVLADSTTVSAAEWFTGMLKNSGRARVIGQNTAGETEMLSGFNLADGSRLYLASHTFQPTGLDNAAWENTGIPPDVAVTGRWDQFTSGDDPFIARAVEILLGR